MSSIAVWGLAARPRTLPAAAAPVMVGTAVAISEGAWEPGAFLFCLVFALLIQVGTNYANDYYDFIKGADSAGRQGPARATAKGFVRPPAMRRAALLTFALAFAAGFPLVIYGGWWLVPIGLACILAGLAYTAGPWPLAYNGLGDVFVFCFFGIVGVTVTDYVHSGAFSGAAFTASLAVGAVITAILVVNNQRDRRDDALAGKKTLAVRFGPGFSIAEYVGLLVLAFGAPVVLAVVHTGPLALLPWILLPWAVHLVRRLVHADAGHEYNTLLGRTALFGLGFSFLLALGILF